MYEYPLKTYIFGISKENLKNKVHCRIRNNDPAITDYGRTNYGRLDVPTVNLELIGKWAVCSRRRTHDITNWLLLTPYCALAVCDRT